MNPVDKDNGFYSNLAGRKLTGGIWSVIFLASTLVGILSLGTLLYSILDDSFGLILLENQKEPEELQLDPSLPLSKHSAGQLADILRSNVRQGILNRLESEAPLAARSAEDLLSLVMTQVVKPQILESWSLVESLFGRGAIEAEAAQLTEKGRLEFRAWINPEFILKPQSSFGLETGVRQALLGSIWVIFIALVFSFPLGIGAAIYLEEYARDNRLNRFIQTNIYNLAGVPSIIYGMLGLTFFVRMLEPMTSGALFGALGQGDVANGRTILAAGLTLALLILPVIIINAQEALKAIPSSLRYSSFGVGATKWQTIWHHVLPSAMDRILTGTVFGISRAMGETAPLVVIGASTFISLDPSGPFSKFTTLPIQIYQWTAKPQSEFQHVAAAAILVLLILLLSLNTFAIIMRNRIRKSKEMG